MIPDFFRIVLFSLIPVLTMVTSGGIAFYTRPNGNLRSLFLHFAAGIVFSVDAVEILPDVVREHKPVQIIIGFISGVITMLLIRHLTPDKKEEPGLIPAKKLPAGLMVGVGVDVFIDGLLLGIGFAAGNTTGILLTVALAVEMISLGIATATELGGSGLRNKKAFGIIILLSLSFLVSSVLGATLLHNLSDSSMEIVLSFGLSSLLFLVTEQLLTEAHEEKETAWHTSVFFLGFLIFLILGIII